MGAGVSPFEVSFWRYPFLVTDPKNFLKAPLAPIYTNCTNFERAGRARQKSNF